MQQNWFVKMSQIKLIIFDFDGVVVDSEHLSSAIHAETLQQVGVPLTPADIDNRYTGLDFTTMMDEIGREYGTEKAARFVDIIEANYCQKMRDELQLMPHILSFLQATNLAFCIASNSKMSRLLNNQQATKIDKIFSNITYSAEMVARPKPAPDLFLYAAEQMGYAPKHCLVIEDGVHGIKAAQDAGMNSLGFVGGSHCTAEQRQKLSAAGAMHIFDDMSGLPAVIESINDGKN